MRLSEVRLIESDRDGEHKRNQLAIGQGVTFVCGACDDAGNDPFSDLHLMLISGQQSVFEQMNSSGKTPYWHSSLLHDARFSVCSQYPDNHWEFIFADEEREYRLSTTRNTKGQGHFFSQMLIGDEGDFIGRQLDLPLLADRNASDESKRESLAELRDRLGRLRDALYDGSTGRGKLMSIAFDYERCLRDLETMHSHILADDQLDSLLESEEKIIADLKKEDDSLAREQRLVSLLERKSEYETLLELRRELKEIEEREGRYGSRITDLGHDITVHELTALAQWRGNAREVKDDLLKLQDDAQRQRDQKVKLEQERILLAHRIRKNQELKDGLLDEYEYLSLKADEEQRRVLHEDESVEKMPKAHSFPSAFHFTVLGSLLALAVGLLFLSASKTAGILLIVLAAVGMLATFGLKLVRRLGAPKDETGHPKNLDKEDLRSQILEVGRQLELDHAEHEALVAAIGELERDMAQHAIEIEAAERQLNRLNDDLLRTINKYAGPSEIHEIDDIIETLSKQRESSASHNEAIADILRRIADLKHGRSDEDMVREYEIVCEQLYGGGQFDVMDAGSLKNRKQTLQFPQTLQLHYDPLRAKQISDERVEIARLIDEKKVLVKETKEKIALSKESLISATSLSNRFAMLEHSIIEMKNDYARLSKSVAWLDQVLETWLEKEDIMRVMAKAARYVGRMSGRRTGDTLPMMPINEPPVQKVRSPGFLEHTVSPYASPIAIDPNVFKQSSADQNYLAFRLAWATQRLSTFPAEAPLLLLSPVIPPEFSQIEELLNTLEEWTLETGRQAVFFTTETYIADIARNRNMVVYRIG